MLIIYIVYCKLGKSLVYKANRYISRVSGIIHVTDINIFISYYIRLLYTITIYAYYMRLLYTYAYYIRLLYTLTIYAYYIHLLYTLTIYAYYIHLLYTERESERFLQPKFISTAKPRSSNTINPRENLD